MISLKKLLYVLALVPLLMDVSLMGMALGGGGGPAPTPFLETDFAKAIGRGLLWAGEKVVDNGEVIVRAAKDAAVAGFEATRDVAKAVGENVEEWVNQPGAEEKMNREIARLEREIDGFDQDDPRLKFNLDRITQLRKEFAAGKALREDLTYGTLKAGREAGVNYLKAKADAETKAAEARVAAEATARGNLEIFKYAMNNISGPRMLLYTGVGSTLISVPFFAARYGIEAAVEEIKAILKTPTLAIETNILSPVDKWSNWVWGIKPSITKVSDVILNPELRVYVDTLAIRIKNTAKNGGYFGNVLFSGPPGTGKTMLSKAIAQQAGVPYILFPASNLDQYGPEECIKVINELFKFATNYDEPIVIVIDECEVLFANRDKNLSEKTRKMLTAFLSFTGTESRDFVLLCVTNRPKDFDDASLSRFETHITIGAPTRAEQQQILDKYIQDFLFSAKAYKPRPVGFIGWLRGKKVRKMSPPLVEDDALDDEMRNWILDNIVGFVGRDVMNMVKAFQSTADATPGRILSREVVQSIVREKVRQRKQVDEVANVYQHVAPAA